MHHALVRPQKVESIPKMMQAIALCYSQYINKKHARTGRLWETRYHSSIIYDEKYLWAVMRYIDQNPKRAGLVKNEEDYPYSSAISHMGIADDFVLSETIFDERQRKEFKRFLKEDWGKGEIQKIRKSIQADKPFGDAYKILRTFNEKIV